jgi:diguanylate cyclase (GGDEF)-like protein
VFLRRSNGKILVICLSVTVLCAHSVLAALFPESQADLLYGFITASTLFAFAACLWRAWHCPPGMKAHWLLLGAGLLCWAVAIVMIGTAEFLYHPSVTTATIEDFFFFFYGVPLLLAIAMPEKSQKSAAFFLLDLIQAIAAGYLAYVALFGVLPFTRIPRNPISQFSLVIVFDVENLILATLATAQLAVSARGSHERQFFKILSSYLWLYAVCITLYNHLIAVTDITASHLTLTNALATLANVPFLVLAVSTFLFSRPDQCELEPAEKTHISLLINNARPIFLGLALVALSAYVAPQHLKVALGFIFGAFVIYGIRSALLQSRLQQTRSALEKANARLEELALQDGLTGIANRRCFDNRLDAEWARAHRSERPLALLLIDVDHFKRLNDSKGHVAGDDCLQSLASIVHGVLRRPGDLLARYGGDEFVALLPETDAAGAMCVASMMMEALAEQGWNLSVTGTPRTVSIGCSCWDARHHATAEELLEAADKALYLAKQGGRNRAEFMEIETAAVQ